MGTIGPTVECTKKLNIIYLHWTA